MRNRFMYFFLKRAFDISASGLAIVVLSPILLLTAVCILIADPGPIFYKAHRVGKGDQPFIMYKFRSMRVNKDARESNFKVDENRVFHFGAFIRKTKIDELPQLINVFIGNMSVVGPRPAAIDQAAMVHAGKYSTVSSVRPGLTGPAAIYDYVYGDTIKDEAEYIQKVLPTRLELEAYYIEHMDVRYDVNWIFQTIRCIFHVIFIKTQSKLQPQLEKLIVANTREVQVKN